MVSHLGSSHSSIHLTLLVFVRHILCNHVCNPEKVPGNHGFKVYVAVKSRHDGILPLKQSVFLIRREEMSARRGGIQPA